VHARNIGEIAAFANLIAAQAIRAAAVGDVRAHETVVLTSPPVVSTDTLAVCVALFTWALMVTILGLAVSRASEALLKSRAFPLSVDCSSSSRSW